LKNVDRFARYASLQTVVGTAAILILLGGCGGSRDPVNHTGSGRGGKSAVSEGGASAGGSDAGGASATTGFSGPCGLPAAGASGVPKPDGTVGNLTVLPWAGFKGAVTYTFDDANSSQIANYATLQALGVHFTFYLQTGKTDAGNAIWAQAVIDGHELGNHTQSHSQTASAADIDAATQFIESKFGVKVWTMASPYGASSYVALAKDRFLINRGVANALIMPNDNADPFSLPCYIPPEGALTTVFDTQIDSAEAGGGWRVVLVHGFAGGSDNAYQAVGIDEFSASVTHAKSLGDLWIDSMVNVGAYWRGQKAFPKTATTSGADQVYSWTLPANFPPGKCLRIKVDGGTLKQGDQTLAWDDHGYYEISLDAGSVTLTP
jgi:peptidoglycan/xylan/chitin deacetylase (PgdA/CDA1 family)